MSGLWVVYSSAFCCGHWEIGEFTEDKDYHYDSLGGETPEEFLASIKNEVPNGQVLSIWFVKFKRFDDSLEKNWIFPEYRDAVRKIPGVKRLGTHINPNTGNQIDGYLWVNKKETT